MSGVLNAKTDVQAALVYIKRVTLLFEVKLNTKEEYLVFDDILLSSPQRERKKRERCPRDAVLAADLSSRLSKFGGHGLRGRVMTACLVWRDVSN